MYPGECPYKRRISVFLFLQARSLASLGAADRLVSAQIVFMSSRLSTQILHPSSLLGLSSLKSVMDLIRTRSYPFLSSTYSRIYRCDRKLGPLIHERALQKVEAHVEDAVSKGAQVLSGGKRLDGKGTFFQPTVLSDVPPNVRLANEETFGPVAALIKFETEDEVLRLANNTEYGLAGYFYSRDVGRIWRVAEALEVGMVGTNTGLLSMASIPFGGIKESGLGMFMLIYSVELAYTAGNRPRGRERRN